ncbi:siderophore-interacting protein [Streptomyces phaeochromogenes]|uniref:Siderophore-interacting protein n=1 Tax=Streptomyces phaeochromogenes TaxID=1923 RepID=A0ABZ1HG95_STRPH|nr:siderophore-interacting protein [Streptomyces phaeochromogenes]WSD17608.1 siderophore-interacting protein [Streptomyces phaeochromogenes]
MPTAVAAPFRFFTLQVTRTRRLSPSLVRVTFTGPDLHAFASNGQDQSLSLFLPRPGQQTPVMPMEYGEGWRQAWIDTPEDVRAVMRSYTLRALRQDANGATTEIDIDFVLHGTEPGAATPAGPASRWAADAEAGDRAVLLGPFVADNTAIRFRPPADADLILIWADETALPAASAILETLPADTKARVWLEVPHTGDRVEPTTSADAEITWLVRDEAHTNAPDEDHDGTPEATTPAEPAEPTPLALEAIRTAQLPSAQAPYAWIAGESGCVKALRRHLVREREIDRRRVTFVGYWRRGLSEEQLRERGE